MNMKKYARVLTLVLTLALLLACFAGIPVSADTGAQNYDVTVSDKGPIYYYREAEAYAGTGVGVKTTDSYICTVGDGTGHALYEVSMASLKAGTYDVIIYMSLQNLSGDKNAKACSFDFNGTSGGSRTAYCETPIYESSFEKPRTFYAVRNTVTLSADITEVELRIYYYNMLNIELDAMMVVDPGTVVPAARAYDDSPINPPEGTTMYDYYNVDMKPENFMDSHSGQQLGECIDGRLEIRNTKHVRRSTNGLAQKIYLTEGPKTAKIYLRTPSDTWNDVNFFTLSITYGYDVLYAKKFTGNDFAGYANKSYYIEVPFESNGKYALDMQWNYRGNFDIIVDKIVFDNKAGSDSKDIVVNGTSGVASVNAAAMSGVSAIDTVVAKIGNVSVRIPAANLIEWLQNYDTVDVSVKDPDSAIKAAMAAKASSYGKTVNDTAAFTLGIQLKKGSQSVTLSEIDNSVEIIAAVDASVLAGKNPKKLYSLSYLATSADKIKLTSGTIAPDGSYVTLLTSTLASYYIGTVDNSK